MEAHNELDFYRKTTSSLIQLRVKRNLDKFEHILKLVYLSKSHMLSGIKMHK